MGQHAGAERAGAVDDAEKIDAENIVPTRLWAEDRGFRADAGIVHQHVHAAKTLEDDAFQGFKLLLLGDIGLDRHDMFVAAGKCDQLVTSAYQPLPAEIGDSDAHPEADEMLGGGKADAGRAAGDDGDAGLLENLLNISHGRSPP